MQQHLDSSVQQQLPSTYSIVLHTAADGFMNLHRSLSHAHILKDRNDVSVTTAMMQVDLPKTADRKLLRVVNYLVQLAAGEGSAGTVVPFSTLSGEQAAASSWIRFCIMHAP
jgi:hypothetical protein